MGYVMMADLSIHVSIAMCAVLTVLFLACAVADYKKSSLLAMIVFALIMLMWRGEAWKAAAIESELIHQQSGK